MVGLAAGLIVVAFKWVLMGRYRPGEYPLWSTFVWRTELVTAAVREPRPARSWSTCSKARRSSPGTSACSGRRIGKRVLLNSSEITEFDLVEIGDDVALNAECTIQTHLFEDRVMKMSTVRIGPGCSVGSQAVVLYDTEMREGSSLNSLSLLMKGEVLPRVDPLGRQPRAPGRRGGGRTRGLMPGPERPRESIGRTRTRSPARPPASARPPWWVATAPNPRTARAAGGADRPRRPGRPRTRRR